VHPTEGDLLETVATWSAAEQERARRVLADIEREAAENTVLMPGIVDLCRALDEASIRRSLVTRNVGKSVDLFHNRHFPLPPFHPAVARDTGGFRHKPHPDALLHCLETWGVDAHHTVMIGDSARDDVAAGRGAGCWTVLLAPGGGDEDGSRGVRGRGIEVGTDSEPHWIARDMAEVHEILRSEFGVWGGQ